MVFVDDYMTWFYSLSHPVMTSYAPGRPLRPVHEEILENKQVRDDCVIDVLSICQNIMRPTYEGIESRRFERVAMMRLSSHVPLFPSHKMPLVNDDKRGVKG